MKQSPIKLFIFYCLQLTWGLIQNVIGLLLFLFNLNKKKKIFNGAIVTYWKYKPSLSLGIFIFMGTDNDRLLAHEYGHSIQSLILGPLYLFIIGIPSFIWAMMYSINKKENIKYYHFYTERWANDLANTTLNTNLMEDKL